jgi:hypothetical protein
MNGLVFAIFHMLLLIGAVSYAFYTLFLGNHMRFSMMAACLLIYYFLVLHKAVTKEIERKKNQKKKAR